MPTRHYPSNSRLFSYPTGKRSELIVAESLNQHHDFFKIYPSRHSRIPSSHTTNQSGPDPLPDASLCEGEIAVPFYHVDGGEPAILPIPGSLDGGDKRSHPCTNCHTARLFSFWREAPTVAISCMPPQLSGKSLQLLDGGGKR
jgi:hypothetical protein